MEDVSLSVREGGRFPLAPHVGPFGRPEFISVLHSHWGQGDLIRHEEGDGEAFGEDVEGKVVGVGHRDLVDYRSPLGPEGASALAALVGERPFAFDSMPGEVVEPLVEAFHARDRATHLTQRDACAALSLPESFDEWLASIGKKERHETRRKRRRYEELVGSPRIERFDASEQRLTEFVELHRTSPGEKGAFMTDPMADYFRSLMSLPGWGIDALMSEHGSMTAAGFGYHGADGYYLYNSAFDLNYREASPGVVLIASLIEFAIESGQVVFDFLKGDEAYKYRLGAQERSLFEVRSAA